MHFPISRQLLTPFGAPLYPVVSILLSFTMIAPTFRLRQVERVATCFVIALKYSSHVGLCSAMMLQNIFVKKALSKNYAKMQLFFTVKKHKIQPVKCCA
jgi:hypothetical protein